MPIIAFEGIRGSGKTTQMQKLFDYCFTIDRVTGYNLITGVEFPLSVNDYTYKLIQNYRTLTHPIVTPETFSELMWINFLDNHYVNSGKTAANHLLVFENYIDSLHAYNHARDYTMTSYPKMSKTPAKVDYTIYLDVDPETGIKRAKQRCFTVQPHPEETVEFLTRVREYFLEKAKTDPKKYIVIDTSSRPIEEVFVEILNFFKANIFLDKMINPFY